MRALSEIQTEVNAYLQKRGVLGYEIALREKECARIDEALNSLDKEAAMARVAEAEAEAASHRAQMDAIASKRAEFEAWTAAQKAKEAKDAERKAFVDDLVENVKAEKVRKCLADAKLFVDDGKNEFAPVTGDAAAMAEAEAKLRAKVEAEGMAK